MDNNMIFWYSDGCFLSSPHEVIDVGLNYIRVNGSWIFSTLHAVCRIQQLTSPPVVISHPSINRFNPSYSVPVLDWVSCFPCSVCMLAKALSSVEQGCYGLKNAYDVLGIL